MSTNTNVNAYTNKNEVTVVGTLVEADIKKGTSKDNKNYVRGTIQIKVAPADSKEIVVEMDVMSMEFNKDGASLKSFIEYQNLPTLIGKKVSVVGNLQENKFWSSQDTLVKNTKVNARFINVQPAGVVMEDKAIFTLSGFVARPLIEIADSDNKESSFALVIGQASYQGDKAVFFTLNADPRNSAAITHITNNYTKGESVELSGVLDFYVKNVETRTVAEFGPDIVKTYQRTIKNFLIVSGAKVKDVTAYDAEAIEKLNAGALADDERVKQEAKSRPASAKTQGAVTPASTTAARSLII